MLKNCNQGKTQPRKRRRSNQVKFQGIHDYWLLFSGFYIPLFIILTAPGSVFLIFLELDPFLYIFQEFCGPFVTQNWIWFALIRYILTVVGLYEFFRLLLLIIVVANAVICVLQKKEFGQWWAAKLETWLMFQLRMSSQILFNVLQASMDPSMTILMALIQIAGIFGLFSLIAMRKVIPMPIYLIFPAITFSSFSGFQVLLVPITSFQDECKTWIERMKSKPVGYKAGIQRKLIRQRIRSMQVLAFHAGISGYRFFQLKKSTKSTFLENIISLSISLLMSPLAKFDAF